METFRGQLKRDGQVVVDGVEGRLSIDNHPARGQLFSGYFTVPAGSTVAINESYELALADGRSSKVRIERVNATNQGQFASFVSDA